MCGSKSSFSYLNEYFHSTVHFGDCSTMKVMGKGDIEIRTKNGFSPLAYSSGHSDHQNVGLPPAQSLNL